MYPAIFLAIGLVVLAVMQGLTSQLTNLAATYSGKLRQHNVVALATRLEMYQLVIGAWPTTVADMAVTPGFEDIRSLLDPWQGYGVSPTITDSSWQFRRAVLFSVPAGTGTTAATYFASNTCGTGSAMDVATTSWCGSKQSLWFKRETREQFTGQIETQRVQMARTLQRLGSAFNVAGAFPSKDSTGTSLVAGNSYSLAALVGYVGDATSCRNTFTLNGGVPLDCSDLFDQWGNAIGYQFVSTKYVILFAETPIVNAAGTAVIVASELDASTL